MTALLQPEAHVRSYARPVAPEPELVASMEPAFPPSFDLSDDELTAQALAADPELAVDDDLPPWSPTATGLMPDWYMPASLPRHRGGWRACVAIAVIVGLVAINAAGLCITYGHLVIA